jgi:cell division protein FtsB
MTTPNKNSPRGDLDSQDVDYEDVDDIIGIAERLRADNENDLTSEELADIGRDLGIPVEYVDQARAELTKRRERKQKETREKKRRRKKKAIIAVAATTILAAVFGIWSSTSVSNLRDLHATVEAKRAQVDNIRSRKAAIEQQFAGRPDSLEKDAQTVGSQNRLRVEIKRLNDAVARYNREAQSFPNSLWTGSQQLPDRVDMVRATESTP